MKLSHGCACTIFDSVIHSILGSAYITQVKGLLETSEVEYTMDVDSNVAVVSYATTLTTEAVPPPGYLLDCIFPQ